MGIDYFSARALRSREKSSSGSSDLFGNHSVGFKIRHLQCEPDSTTNGSFRIQQHLIGPI